MQELHRATPVLEAVTISAQWVEHGEQKLALKPDSRAMIVASRIDLASRIAYWFFFLGTLELIVTSERHLFPENSSALFSLWFSLPLMLIGLAIFLVAPPRYVYAVALQPGGRFGWVKRRMVVGSEDEAGMTTIAEAINAMVQTPSDQQITLPAPSINVTYGSVSFGLSNVPAAAVQAVDKFLARTLSLGAMLATLPLAGVLILADPIFLGPHLSPGSRDALLQGALLIVTWLSFLTAYFLFQQVAPYVVWLKVSSVNRVIYVTPNRRIADAIIRDIKDRVLTPASTLDNRRGRPSSTR